MTDYFPRHPNDAPICHCWQCDYHEPDDDRGQEQQPDPPEREDGEER